MNKDKQARWKGEYYCSLCCEIGDIREQRCPNCHALMYTQQEYVQKMKKDYSYEL